LASVASGGLIVLAEDDERMRRLYDDALSVAGFSVLAASDGVEALAYLAKVTPRLVILDIMMPKLNGIETCKRARNIIGSNVPILFLSALDRIDILRDCVAAGGDDYLIKSDSILSLIERIKNWMRHAQRQGLVARRAKLLQDLNVEVAAAAPEAPKAPKVEPAQSKESDSDMACLLALVQEALECAGPAFGKTPDHKQYLAGYIAGIIESWSAANGASKEMFLTYLQAILEATGLVTPADAAETAAAYDELSKGMIFRKGKARGRDDATRRQSQGPGHAMTGLADAGSANAAAAAG
jgi:DNA-binding response OmpR family regulator